MRVKIAKMSIPELLDLQSSILDELKKSMGKGETVGDQKEVDICNKDKEPPVSEEYRKLTEELRKFAEEKHFNSKEIAALFRQPTEYWEGTKPACPSTINNVLTERYWYWRKDKGNWIKMVSEQKVHRIAMILEYWQNAFTGQKKGQDN